MGAALSEVEVDKSWRPTELPWEATKKWAVVNGLPQKNAEWNGRTVEVMPSSQDGCADIIFYGALLGAMRATVPKTYLTYLGRAQGCKYCGGSHATSHHRTLTATISWGKKGEGTWQNISPCMQNQQNGV